MNNNGCMVELKNLISKELRLVVLLSLPKLDARKVQQVEELIRVVVLGRVKDLVSHHRVWPCVYCNVRDHFLDQFPVDFVDWLEEKYSQSEKKSHRQFRVSGSLLRLLKQQAIPVKILKGLPLAYRLYGDISKRHSSDLDLVINRNDFEAAHKLLIRAGFQTNQFESLTAKQQATYFEAHKDVSYYDEFNTVIELHLRLSCFDIDLTHRYLEALVDTRASSEKLQLLDLLYLCWHGSHTLFHRLKWLVDVALYIEQLNDQDISHLINLATELGAVRLLTVSWILSNELFETQMPSEMIIYYQHDFATRVLVARCLVQLKRPRAIRSLRFKFDRFICEPLLYQHWNEKLVAIGQKFKPKILDFSTIPILPRALFFLYYPLRLLLFIYRRTVRANILNTTKTN